MIGGVPFPYVFGVIILILMVEVVDWLVAFARRRRTSDDEAAAWQGPFTLRRPGSELRARHRREIDFTGFPGQAVRHCLDSDDDR